MPDESLKGRLDQLFARVERLEGKLAVADATIDDLLLALAQSVNAGRASLAVLRGVAPKGLGVVVDPRLTRAEAELDRAFDALEKCATARSSEATGEP